MYKSYKIRDINISPGLVLAPMSGVTTRPFRRLIRKLNPGCVGLTMSEFVSVEGMTRHVPRTLEMMRFDEDERPYAIQIFGYDVSRMRDAAKMVEDYGADIVDINCGCPAPKVVRRGGGCELMRQPTHLSKILSAVRSAVKIPVTMKMRSGWDEQSKNYMEVAKVAESEGMEALAIHGRTRSQLYRGLADWNVVEEVANELKIPVIGSGDVIDAASATERLSGRVSGAYIGRASLFNPFVFSEIAGNTTVDLRHNPGLLLSIVTQYAQFLREDFSDKACVGKLKQLISQMCRGVDWRKPLLLAESFADQMKILEGLNSGSHEIVSRPEAIEQADLT